MAGISEQWSGAIPYTLVIDKWSDSYRVGRKGGLQGF